MVQKDKIKKILLITLSNIGDIVLTTPVLGVLHKEFPESRVDVLSGPNGSQIFTGHPFVFRFVTYDKHSSLRVKKSLIKDLRRERYDCVVDLRNSLFPFLVGARYKAFWAFRSPKAIKHKKKVHLYKLRRLNINLEDAPFSFFIGEEDEFFINELLKKKGVTEEFVAVSPGAKSHIKRWGQEGFAGLCNRIMDELKAHIVIVGDEKDREITSKIKKIAKNKIIDTSGQLSLKQLGALLRRSKLLVTNDSAPMHIAWACGVKVVAIFGPTDPDKYGPYGEGSIVVRKELHCSPCEVAQCKYKHECMQLIDVQEVFDAAKKLLNDEMCTVSAGTQ